MAMTPLEQRPILVEEAYRAILDEIAEGRLAPGERLRQEAVAARLQVSRQPVSHALALLKQEGFLVEAGRRGLEVAPLDPDYLLASYQVRAALDATAARLAATRVKERPGEAATDLAALNEVLAEGEGAVGRATPTALVKADMAFHQALNRLSGNPVLEETAARQWGHIRRAMHAVLAADYQAERIWREHAGIVAAVCAGDPERAAERARAHAENAGRVTQRRLAERRTPDASEEENKAVA